MIDGFRKVACSLTGTIDEMNWGAVTEDGNEWLGVNGIDGEFTKLLSSLENDLPEKIKSRFSGNSDILSKDYDDIKAQLEKVYTDFKDKEFPNPDPTGAELIKLDYF